jgi:hypothetical protein
VFLTDPTWLQGITMYQEQIAGLKDSINNATQQHSIDYLSEKMFSIFFERYPEARDYFGDYDLSELGEWKFQLIAEIIVDGLEYPRFASHYIDEEVYRHLRTHNLRDKEYYFGLIDAVYETVKTTLNSEWNEDYDEYWREAIAGMRYTYDVALKENIKSVTAS